MFKLGVINDEVSQDFATVVNFVKEFNLHSIEIRSVWDKLPHELTESDIDEMKRLLDGTDIEIIGVASPFFKCEMTTQRNGKNISVYSKGASERQRHLILTSFGLSSFGTLVKPRNGGTTLLLLTTNRAE